MSATPQDKLIRLGQCLHGYMDGHRLLETSRKLSSEAEKLMQVMSDMSGPSMIPSFESYITGYPLQDLGVYALGRTWYAPEMKRPGCVWTHTLLIENSDLAQIRDLRVLLEMFDRPSSDRASWSQYRSSIFLPPTSKEPEFNYSSPILYEEIWPQILVALYGKPDRPIYIPVNTASEYEELFFLIWNQQWPRLRRSFTFSTGSIAYRKTAGKPFDLQAISQKSLNRLAREVPKAVSVLEAYELDMPRIKELVLVAADDLRTGSSGRLRKFFQQYGVDTTRGRAAFFPLAEIYTYVEGVNQSVEIKKLVELTGQSFPEPNEASRLKMCLFGGQGLEGSLLKEKITEADILWELSQTPLYTAFDREQLEIRNRAKLLLENQRDIARNLTFQLFGSQLTPLGEEFLTGISEAINFEDAYEFARSNPELLNAFTKYNPALAAMPGLWRSSADEQRDFFDIVVADSRTTERAVSDMIVAMLEAGSDVLAEEVITKYRKTAVKTVLDWVNRDVDASTNLGLEWHRSLRLEPEELLGWLKKTKEAREQTVSFIISLLDPHSPAVLDFGAKIWIPFSKKAGNILPYYTLVKSMAFLLALGFNNVRSGAPALVVNSFELVHQAAGDNDLTGNSWRLLKDQAPDFSTWWSWDKCRRLRRALIDKFIDYEWPPEQFLRALEEPRTFKAVLRDSDDTSHGRQFIASIAQMVAQDLIEATPAQRAVLGKLYY